METLYRLSLITALVISLTSSALAQAAPETFRLCDEGDEGCISPEVRATDHQNQIRRDVEKFGRTKPRSGICGGGFDDDGRNCASEAATQSPLASAENPLAAPAGMSGVLAECWKKVTGGTENKPKYDEGTRAAEWQAAFDADWNESTRGSGNFQQQMLAKGNVWVEGRGWVEGGTIRGEQQACVAGQLKTQINRLMAGLTPEQQLTISLIANQIMAESDPAKRMEQLQRLRQGTFLMISADADRAWSEMHHTEAAETVADTVTMTVPLVNDSRDLYELWNGRDAWTNRELAWWERALTAGGLLIGSGKAWREAINKLRSVPVEEAVNAGKLTQKEIKLVDEALAGGNKVPESLTTKIPDFEARKAAAEEVRKQAKGKVDDYITALKSRDPERIQKAVIEVKGDRQAITLLNKETNFVKKKFNDEMSKVYGEVDEAVKKRVAELYNKKIIESGKNRKFTPNQRHGQPGTTVSADAVKAGEGIKPADVSIFSASNPTNSVKVPRDRDHTIRIFGQDIPSKEAREVYNQALFDTLQSKGMLPKGVTNPKELGEKLDQTAVHWLDAEAYNRKDLEVVLDPAEEELTKKAKKGNKKAQKALTERRVMGDPRQVGETMQFKGVENFAKADGYRKVGQLGKAEEHMMEGMYQLRKQFDNQLMGRIRAAQSRGLIDFDKVRMPDDLRNQLAAARQAGDKTLIKSLELQAVVPDRLRKSVEIFRKVEDGMSPAEAQALLRAMGKTPDDIARELKEALVEWEIRIMSKGR